MTVFNYMTFRERIGKITGFFSSSQDGLPSGSNVDDKTKKKTEVLSWENIPESEGSLGYYLNESPPDWREDDYGSFSSILMLYFLA